MANRLVTGSRLVLAVCFLASGAWLGNRAGAQGVIDEARQAKRSAQSFPAADEDYFRAMDGGIPFSPDEVKGRNMWILWTGGNDRLWDELTNLTFGNFDLLKILSSYPGLKYSRDNRWDYFGLVNEPCFSKATGPNPQRYGLWLDVRDPNCPADPFENAEKYPGVAIGARGKNMPKGSYYGYPTGIVGMRLFPNPDFDEAARRNGMPSGSTAIPTTTSQRSWCVLTESGFRAVSVTSVRTPRNRQRIPRRPNGRT